MDSVGDAFGWPFQDSGWLGKVVVQGLIAIIPILGWMALVGWMVMTIDNYRSGRRELAPAGFHLGRGAPLFVVYFIYSFVFSLPGDFFSGIGTNAHNTGASGFGSLISLILSLFLAFLAPAIILHTYRGGFAGGFDFGGIWQMATTNTSNTVIAGLLIWVSGLIGIAGIVVCCVGLLFTLPYGAAVVAGVVTWYERMLTGPAPTVA